MGRSAVRQNGHKLIPSVSANQPKGLLTANLPTIACVGKVVAFGTADCGWAMGDGADSKPAVARNGRRSSWSSLMTVPQDTQQEVNGRIIDALERGIEPWRRPFDPARSTGRPRSITTLSIYSGINAHLLDLHSIENGFRSHWHGTKRDWRKVGGVVMEPGCQIVVNGRYVMVYNAEQVVGGDQWRVPCSRWEHIPDFSKAQELIVRTGADIRCNGDRCIYIPPVPPGMFVSDLKGDYIEMPGRHDFRHEQNFFYVAFHELSHWCEPRLGWADHDEMSEFIAENTACSLCRDLGVPPWGGELVHEEHAAQLKRWVEVLGEDARYVFDACEQASKTIDYLLSFVKDDNRQERAG